MLASALMGVLLWYGAGLLAGWFSQGEMLRAAAAAILVIGGVLTFGIAAQLFGALRLGEVRPLLRGSD